MQRSNLDRLTDIVIGEAVTMLLGNAGRVNASALVASLKRMAVTESNPERLAALKSALDEVQKEFPRTRESQDASVLTFGTAILSGSKKH